MVRHWVNVNIDAQSSCHTVQKLLPHHRSAPLDISFDCKLQQPSVASNREMKWKWNDLGRRHDQHWRPLHRNVGSQPKFFRGLVKNTVGLLDFLQVRRRPWGVRAGQFLESPTYLIKIAMGHSGALGAQSHRARHRRTMTLVANSVGYSRTFAAE